MTLSPLRNPLRCLAIAGLLLLGACASREPTQRGEAVQPPPVAVELPDGLMPDSPAFYDDGRVRVALLAPLSGEHAGVGRALVNAAQMALFDVADDGFALTVKDTRGEEAGARAAMEEARREGVQLVLGPLFAHSVRAVRSEAAQAGIPVLAFSNDRALAAPGVYVMGLTPRAEVDRVVDHAVREGRRRIGLLTPSSAYGEAVAEALRAAAQRYGAEVVVTATYDPRAPDFSGAVREFARQGGVSRNDSGQYDAVMVPAGGRELLSLAALLPYYDVNPQRTQYLGTRLWEDASLGSEPALAGGWFAAPSRDSWERFVERYRELHGSTPPRVASVAYDATALAAVLVSDFAAGSGGAGGFAQQNLPGRAFHASALQNADGFAGVDGLFRLMPDGNVERGLAVYALQRGGFVQREPAPQSFQPLIN